MQTVEKMYRLLRMTQCSKSNIRSVADQWGGTENMKVEGNLREGNHHVMRTSPV